MKAKVSWFLDNVEEMACGGLLLFISAMLFIQVVCRYGFGMALDWSEEVNRFAFMFMVYLAGSLGIRRKMHVRVTAQLKLFPRSVQLFLFVLVDLIWIAFNTVVFWQGMLFLASMKKNGMMSAAMMIDMRYVYWIIPFSFMLSSVRIAQNWVDVFRGAKLVLPAEQEF